MLSCQELVGLVTEYLEGTLTPEERLRFEQHVAICPPCRGYLAQMRKTLRIAGKLREDELEADVRDTLLHTFRDWRREQAL